ncbi:MAG: redoxin domain-containing protein [Saprospiraceae bacterium]|nr:redoxin domain-containing protein [Saprospiraceae bacterium]
MYGVKVDDQLFRLMQTNVNQSLYDLSMERPIMLVFLRHFGCTFCREALADISEKREVLESLGAKLVFVHMAEREVAERYFNRYNIPKAIHISDPQCNYYKAFGLMKGNFTQLFGLQTWIRGFQAGLMEGHGIGPQLGDGFQMPGVFVIQDGELKEAFIHKLASDRPDYEGLVKNCCALI